MLLEKEALLKLPKPKELSEKYQMSTFFNKTTTKITF